MPDATPLPTNSEGESLLIALRGDEAEPVLVILEGNATVLVLDDGERLVFDARELLAALSVPVRVRRAA